MSNRMAKMDIGLLRRHAGFGIIFVWLSFALAQYRFDLTSSSPVRRSGCCRDNRFMVFINVDYHL